MYRSGSKFCEISRSLSIPYSVLARAVKGVHQDFLGKVDVRRALTAEEEIKVVDIYTSSLRSAKDIAKDFGCCDATILATLERYGERRRNRGTRVWSEEDKKRLSARVKKDWVERREHYLAGIRKVSWKPDGRILEMRLTITARRKLTKLVIGRDGKCVRCFSTDKLHVHHIKSIQDRPDLAADPSNCETLCSSCHSSEEAKRRWEKRKRDVLPIQVKP